MSEDTASWSSLMDEFAGSYAEAAEFSDWMPPVDMELNCVPLSVRTGTYDVDGRKVPYWAVKAQLLDGLVDGQSLAGQEFDLGFFSTKNEGTRGMLKGFAKHLSGGQTINDLKVCDSLIRGCPGKYQIKFKTVAGQQAGRINCRIVKAEALEAPAAT